MLSNQTITAVVCGATSIEQLQENMAATEITLSQEELDACDEVWHQLRPPKLFYGR
ncbi:MAG: aldo/keto reductase [Planctomycetota bacterium]